MRLWAGLVLLTAGACTKAAVQGEVAVPADASAPAAACDPSKAQSLVGEAATAELAARAQRLTGARAVRTIRPGDAVTMDFREDRLNIELDAQGRVRVLRCG